MHQPITSASTVIPGVRKIAVLRANSLGDLLFAFPALHALRSAYPCAEIVLLAKEWHRSFLHGRPSPVNRVIVVPKCNGIPHETDRIADPAEVEDFFSRMKQEQFDIALQLHGGGKNSNPFVNRLGAKLTAGHRTPGADPLDINVPYFLYQHEVLRYLEVVARIGAVTAAYEPVVHVTSNDREEAGRITGDVEKPYVVLHPGASDVQRRWAPVKFAEVGNALASMGFHVYVTGIGNERQEVNKVIQCMSAQATDLCDRLSLNGLTALLAGTALLVSNDTGPLHLARALGTRTVGIYWAGNVITAGIITAEKHRVCIAWNYHCPLCGTDCAKEDIHHPAGDCDHKVSFVDEIAVDEVISYAGQLLAPAYKTVSQ